MPPSAATANPSATAPAPNPLAPSDLAWRVIGLASVYRLLIPPAILIIQWLTGPEFLVRARQPYLLLTVAVGYFAAGLLLLVSRGLNWPTLRSIALVNAAVDVAGITLILYASGGVGSGLGILLVLPVGAMAILAGNRDVFLIAAVAALAVLAQQIVVGVQGIAPATDYTTAGVLGAVLFVIGLSVWPIAHRLRESEALVRRQEVDLANLAQLSQYVVQHLRESILVVDTEDRIRLINESAAQILGDRAAYPGALLGEASPRLLYLLERWRKAAGYSPDPEATFVSEDGASIVHPHFAPLGSAETAPILVFLEDTSVLAEKVQQSKLAALGRLSASIAHEIRNPVGAMSHAGQLLGESPQLAPEDKRLTEIIRTNAERVSTIINNVLKLSRREAARIERLELGAWIGDFGAEFCATMQWPVTRLTVASADPGGESRGKDIAVRADPTQLRQILWNLCDNAIRHGVKDSADRIVEIRYGRIMATARPFLEVADRGPGVPAENLERIFEPFFSGERGGTGLGLFLARELAQTNGATLLYEPRPGGGSTFRLVFADPQRWQNPLGDPGTSRGT
ncbi:MAG TPA: PAS domain-containing sensor histidine kinase [Steroidobacteraceae bacterium]|nr:PAS domain-containing sensor histidine kinase [Steroidobacteraceae bacterium]